MPVITWRQQKQLALAPGIGFGAPSDVSPQI